MEQITRKLTNNNCMKKLFLLICLVTCCAMFAQSTEESVAFWRNEKHLTFKSSDGYKRIALDDNAKGFTIISLTEDMKPVEDSSIKVPLASIDCSGEIAVSAFINQAGDAYMYLLIVPGAAIYDGDAAVMQDRVSLGWLPKDYQTDYNLNVVGNAFSHLTNLCKKSKE